MSRSSKGLFWVVSNFYSPKKAIRPPMFLKNEKAPFISAGFDFFKKQRA